MRVKCSKCGQSIAVSDIVESSSGRLSHLDCARRRSLTADERRLLLVYCSDHVAAHCLACGGDFRLGELAADPLQNHTRICPRCRKDLTENVRAHLYACAMLPSEVRHRAQAVREAAQRLVKQSQQLRHNADVLMREAESALFGAQLALRAAMRPRTPS